MKVQSNRQIENEKKTIRIMIRLYCDKNHSSGGLCGECAKIMEYSLLKIEKCIFAGRKPVCSKCRVHCYKPGMRKSIKAIMRYSGPRMLFKHPFLALLHLKKSIFKSNGNDKKRIK
jgi:hypothetical protein